LINHKTFWLSGFFLTVLLTAFMPVHAQKDRKKRPTEGMPMAIRLREAEASFTDGEKYFILEDYAKALYYFQRALELNSENATIHYKVAEILSKGNKQDDLLRASVSIENALALEKKNKYFYVLASTIYSGLNNFGQAAQMIEAMIKEIPGTEEYLYELAALYQYDHKPEEAVRVYNRAETILGISEISSLQKQRLFLEQGKVPEAIHEGQKLIDAFPEEERYVVGFAEILSQYKQGAKAIAYIENYLKEHPESGSAKILLAGLYRDNGQDQKSHDLMVAVFDDPTVQVNSKAIMLSVQIASLNQHHEKNVAEAEAFLLLLFTKLKKSNPHDAMVHVVGGDLYLALKQSSEAESEYRAAIHNGSVNFDAWQNLLGLELQQNEFDSLISHTEQGLEFFPSQAVLYYFNGYAQLRKKHYREAVISLEQAKKIATSNLSEINGMLGDAYNGMKDYTKSDQAYEDALTINPDNDLVLNNYCYFLALRKENLEKAEKMSARLIKNHPDNPSYLDTYGWVLFMREKYKEARKVMEKAIGSGNNNATFFEHYGDILYQLGNVDEAVTQWEKSKSLNNGNAIIDKKIANRKLY
jgi:tetratricopeptide (TPR) repeat protein